MSSFLLQSHDISSEINLVSLNRESLAYITQKPSKPHRNNFQAIIWIKNGSGTHLIDDKLYHVEPNTFMLISKGQVHAFNPTVDTFGWAIRFADSFLDSTAYQSKYKYTLFSNITVNSVLNVEMEEISTFETLMNQIQQEYDTENKPGRTEILQRLVEVLIIKLVHLKQTQFTSQFNADLAAYQLFQQFNAHLENHFKSEHDVSSYAERLNVSPRKLSESLKLFVGKPPSRIILERIIVEAKRYLRFSGMSVKETGFALGFNDPSYFSKVFKKVEGISPKAFKDEMQKIT